MVIFTSYLFTVTGKVYLSIDVISTDTNAMLTLALVSHLINGDLKIVQSVNSSVIRPLVLLCVVTSLGGLELITHCHSHLHQPRHQPHCYLKENVRQTRTCGSLNCVFFFSLVGSQEEIIRMRDVCR